MGKRELIDRILSINTATTREYLADFSERDLSDYWRQLQSGPAHAAGRSPAFSAAKRRPAPPGSKRLPDSA